MGPPGAGKGTQAKRLADTFGMEHLSSGYIFRAQKASGSKLGKKLSSFMQAGLLVPDDIVVQIMAEAITRSQAPGGLLLDGFPRTVPQAQALDEQLAKAGKPLDAVVVLQADDEEIVRRITGRRVAPSTGRAYHVKFMPPKVEGVCDDTGEKLVQRDDDKEEVVRKRLAAYYEQTRPVIDYYRRRGGVSVVEVNGSRPPHDVTASLIKALQGAVNACERVPEAQCGGAS